MDKETEELNKKLLKFAGFLLKPTVRSFGTIDWPDYSWHTPDGEILWDENLLPDFLNSDTGLSLQFKWLVPKIDKFSEVQLIKTSKGWACKIIRKVTTDYSWYQRASTPELALGKAIFLLDR